MVIGFVERTPGGELKGTNASVCTTVGEAVAEAAAQAAQVRASLPDQPALPVQHHRIRCRRCVMTGRTDRAENDAARAVHLLPDEPVARPGRQRHAWPRRSTCSGFTSTSRSRAFRTGFTSKSSCRKSWNKRGFPRCCSSRSWKTQSNMACPRAARRSCSGSKRAILDDESNGRAGEQPDEEWRPRRGCRHNSRGDRARSRERLPAARRTLREQSHLPLRRAAGGGFKVRSPCRWNRMVEDSPVRVLIADDEPLAAERLQLLLARAEGAQLVGTASDGEFGDQPHRSAASGPASARHCDAWP